MTMTSGHAQWSDSMKPIIPIIFIIIFLSISYAQPGEIKIDHVGYGGTPQEIRLAVYNTGNRTLHELKYYVDDESVRERNSTLTKGNGLKLFSN